MKRKRASPPLPVTIDDVPEGPLQQLLVLAVPQHADSLSVVLRSVCRRWNLLLRAVEWRRAPFPKGSNVRREDELASALLLEAGSLGYVGICKLALEWHKRPRFTQALLGRAVSWVAFRGQEASCKLFHRWLGPRLFNRRIANKMIRNAAIGGHVGLCVLARTWGAKHMASRVFVGGADGGHDDVVELGIRWGGVNYDSLKLATHRAARRGRLAMVTRLLSMDSPFPSAALSGGIEGGHVDVCELAVEKCDGDVEQMLARAACAGQKKTCRLAKEWGAKNFLVMLGCAALHKHPKICRLAMNWGAENDGRTFEGWHDAWWCHHVPWGRHDVVLAAQEFLKAL